MSDEIKEDGVVAWRLGEVEKNVKEMKSSLDKHLDFQRDFAVLKVHVDSLITSRNRIIVAVTGLATGFILMVIGQFFGR